MSRKILSVAIPSYNSAAYMEHCIQTLLSAGERIEILIVDDGSKDETGAIADRYEKEYPSIVKAIHQENGGHGEGVNTGIKNATGLFYKVVDSDDWVDEQVLAEVMDRLEELGERVDMFVTNFLYDKVGVAHKKTMEYSKYMPTGKVFTWEEMKPFPVGKYLLMHAIIYRTEVLRQSGMVLPKHTFYVDNIFVFDPFPYVKHIYYLDKVLYHYYIGREDQSVNEKVMISRLDQQMRVNRLMAQSYLKSAPADGPLQKYMFNYLSIITTISSVLAIKSGTEENLAKKKQLWEDIREMDAGLYLKLRHTILGVGMNLPGKAGRKIAVWGYKISQKIYDFN
ncbi:MAG: glycosyltransferase [Lachnospiraceae bacterium]|nr:glycosyltransferase [Lachnospiraceae bacterium]